MGRPAGESPERPFSDLPWEVGFLPQAGNSRFGRMGGQSRLGLGGLPSPALSPDGAPAWLAVLLPWPPDHQAFPQLLQAILLSDFPFKSIRLFSQKSMSFYLNIFYPNFFPLICRSV